MLQWCRRLRLLVVLVLGVALLQQSALALHADQDQAPCPAHVTAHAPQGDQGGHADRGSAMDPDTVDPGAPCATTSCAMSACGDLCLALPSTAIPAVIRLAGHAPPADAALCVMGTCVAPETPPPIV
jgi:hypothetical protein